MSSKIRVLTSGQLDVDYEKPSVPGDFQMRNFQSPGGKLACAERSAMAFNVRSASTSHASAELRTLMPPPTEIPLRHPGPPNLAPAKRDVPALPPSALLTARVIENLNEVAYPEGIKGPRVELNANAKDGRFRYDRDFLMQFMHICKEKPPTLPALDVLGIEPIDQVSFPPRGGSGRHRNACSASTSCATAELCASMPSPTEIPRRRSGPLDLISAKRDVSAPPPSALLTARVIGNLSEITYPEGIKGLRVELNVNVRDGRFRYDRDFLMQFMHICKEKPPTLPALDVLGIEPVDRSSFPMALGGPGCHRNASGAMPISTNRQASVGLGIGGFQKPSIPSGFQMGNFQSPGSKLTSEERFSMSNSCSASTSSASSQFRSTVACTLSTSGPGHPIRGTKRIRTKRGERRDGTNKAPMSQEEHGSGFGAGFEPVTPLELSANRWVPTSTTRKAQPGVDSPELVDRKVKALLNKLTMEKFETISDQIIHWANKSVNEKDGRTLIQVTRLVFENLKATDEAWSGMYYALLCRKMMEQISPEVQAEGIKNTGGKPIAGGQLFRKHLLSRCQEDFERGWFPCKEATAATAAAKISDHYATKAAHKKIGTKEAELFFDEYYAAEKARRQGLVLIRFIGELFKLQMLTERIMHAYVKRLLGDIENREEEKIESLCQLLRTIGQLLDTPKAWARMDVYFTRMRELGKSHNVSTRMQFMLQDVIELRDRAWMSRNAAPMRIAAVHVLAAKEKAAAEKESFNRRQIGVLRDGFRRGDNRNREHGPDGLAVAGGSSVPRAPPKAGDLLQFGKITKGQAMAMAMGPSGVFAAGKKDSKRETLSRTDLSSNMFHMLSQTPELAAEASTKLNRSSRLKPGVDFGHAGVPEPAVQRRKLQLLPRSVLAAEENATTLSEEEPENAPTTISKATVKKIDKDVKEFFAVRNLQKADDYFLNLPDKHRFRLVNKLVASALESKETDARLVGDFFAQAMSNGQCTLEVFEKGFMPMVECLDDIAIDAPKAFDYMAIMLRGAGFWNEPERLRRIASKLEDSDKLVSLVA